MMEEGHHFGLADTFVFVGMLLISLLIGGYYAFKDKRKHSIENYYFGERKMSPIPVGLSTGVSFISSVTILAYPAHAYIHGTGIAWFGLCTVVQVVISCIYYIPLLHRIHLTSLYEYLELRFNKVIRTAASLMIIINMLVYLGTAIYLTALAISATTLFGMAISIVLTSGICTIYTTVGGLKAVIWNDVFQSGIMISGICALLIKTTIDVGGVNNVWQAVKRGKRNTFWEFNADPTITHTVWTMFVGNGINWVGSMCTDQAITQRYQSCKNAKDAKIACIIADIVMVTMLVAATCTGCAIYAYYEGCDPFLTGDISKRDQIVPYVVMEVFKSTPGMAGLFVSAAYSGMLSTVSTGLNSMSVLILQDYILSFKSNLGERAKLTISKFLCLSLGIVVTGMAFLPELTGFNVVQFGVSVAGSFSGPLLGLFIIAMHFPWTNAIGAALGLVCGVLLTNWANFGQMIYKAREVEQPVFSTHLCANWTMEDTLNYSSRIPPTSVSFLSSTTTVDFTTSLVNQNRPFIADTLYSISYLYFGALGMCATVAIGLLVSFLTGRNDPKKMDVLLFVPLVDNKHLPEIIVNFFRFGVPKYTKERRTTSIDESFLNGQTHSKMELSEHSHTHERGDEI